MVRIQNYLEFGFDLEKEKEGEKEFTCFHGKLKLLIYIYLYTQSTHFFLLFSHYVTIETFYFFQDQRKSLFRIYHVDEKL